MKMDGIDEFMFQRIESICNTRLKRTVSTYDILRWLGNFKKHEYGKALKVLEYLDVYTEEELVELWDIRLKQFLTQFNNKSRIFIMPVSEFGKSGTLMTYYIKKTPTYLYNPAAFDFIVTPIELKHKFKSGKLANGSTIAFVDDFIGSGKSFLRFYKHAIYQQLEATKNSYSLFLLSLFSLFAGKKLLSKSIPEIIQISELKNRAFASRGSVFGYREVSMPIRNFCYDYGQDLFETTNQKGDLTKHPLGYENSQALIVFPYNPPNNTLPIIWSAKGGHYPLFPRNPQMKISEAKDFRKKMAHYISMLKHTDFATIFATLEKKLEWKTIHIITQTDFQNFSIMFMKRQKRAVPTICQVLGITEHDYQDRIKQMTKTGLLDASGNITTYGSTIYFELQLSLQNTRKELKKTSSDYEIRILKYLPKQFQGKSLTD